MATAVADLLELTKGLPAGGWVAISEKQHVVVAYGANAQTVLAEAKSKGEESPLLVRVPNRVMPMFFPSHSLVKL